MREPAAQPRASRPKGRAPASRTNLREVAPDVFRLGSAEFNCYLLRDGKRFTLVDAGLPGFWPELVDTLDRLGGGLDQVDAVLVSHAHLDHVGMASRVHEEAGATIHLHPGDARRALKGGAQIPPLGMLLNSWRGHPFRMLTSAVFRYRVFSGPPIRDFEPLPESGRLDVPGNPVALFVPGHTVGSMAFWLPERRVLFAGDALVTIDMLRGTDPAPQLTPKRTEADREQALASLRAFETLGNATLLTGHGDPWTGDLQDAVRSAETRARRRR